MISDMQRDLVSRVRKAGQWVLWSPWRVLAVVLAVVVIVWSMALVRQLSTAQQAVPTAAPSHVGLPEGWQDWPSVVVTVTPTATTTPAR